MKATTGVQKVELSPVLDAKQILRFQEVVRQVVVADHVFNYAVDLVRATRPEEATAPAFIKEQVGWGAGPRASQALILCAKTYAALHGRVNVSCDDVRHVALPVLRHRIAASFAAEAEGVRTDQVIRRLLEEVPERKKS